MDYRSFKIYLPDSIQVRIDGLFCRQQSEWHLDTTVFLYYFLAEEVGQVEKTDLSAIFLPLTDQFEDVDEGDCQVECFSLIMFNDIQKEPDELEDIQLRSAALKQLL